MCDSPLKPLTKTVTSAEPEQVTTVIKLPSCEIASDQFQFEGFDPETSSEICEWIKGAGHSIRNHGIMLVTVARSDAEFSFTSISSKDCSQDICRRVSAGGEFHMNVRDDRDNSALIHVVILGKQAAVEMIQELSFRAWGDDRPYVDFFGANRRNSRYKKLLPKFRSSSSEQPDFTDFAREEFKALAQEETHQRSQVEPTHRQGPSETVPGGLRDKIEELVVEARSLLSSDTESGSAFGERCDLYTAAAKQVAEAMLEERIRRSFVDSISGGKSTETAVEKILHARKVRQWLEEWNLAFQDPREGVMQILAGKTAAKSGQYYFKPIKATRGKLSRWTEVSQILCSPTLVDVSGFIHSRENIREHGKG